MYAKNLLNFILPMFNEAGEFAPDFENDEVIAGALLTRNGDVKPQATRELLDGEAS
jgi:NAD/NADP transhydrogenase alpha subunit